jgi:patatin-related protein
MSAEPAEGIVEEIRFGAVLYGGVSLCIYINGVTQELLRLVQATGPQAADFSGTRGIYRKLAMLSSGESAKGAAARWEEVGKKLRNGALKRKFIVDALSGTSAGGINAVFLAKALVKGQSLDGTKDFWIDEGGIEKLINDSESFQGLGLTPKGAPASLLNSQRMYAKLLEALNQMEGTASPDKASLAEEIDLFITTTDLAGRKVSIPLADQVVSEKDYHQAFHFSHNPASPGKAGVGEFDAARNPFLAFAARCTSAFPVAFEPMRGIDAQEQLVAQKDTESAKRLENPEWERFLRENVVYGKDEGDPEEKNPGHGAKAEASGFRKRSFGDGGILDNKPFSYILDALGNRTAGPLVERKLIYIDPSPENPDDGSASGKPDALAYGLKALIGLPGYETIRADVRNIINRNRLIDKVNSITRGIVSDLKLLAAATGETGPVTDDSKTAAGGSGSRSLALRWEEKGLDDLIPTHGMAYGGYHRLKITALTEDWSLLIAKNLDWQNHPWRLHVLREVFRSWRNEHYRPMRVPGARPASVKSTENLFLYDFDLSYRKRRLAFVLEKADALLRLDPNALAVLDRSNRDSLVDPPAAGQEKDFEDRRRDFRKSIQAIKLGLKAAHAYLLRGEAELFRAGGPGSTPDALAAFKQAFLRIYLAPDSQPTQTGLDPQIEKARQALEKLKTMPEERRMRDLKELFSPDGNGHKLVECLHTVMEKIRDEKLVGIPPKPVGVFPEARTKCEGAFVLPPDAPEAGVWARDALRSFFRNFDYYDMVLFPLTYCTEVGEVSRVAIHRISPQSLSPESGRNGPSRSELAGVAFGHFGAFLDKRWRRNDILWGRLDAVEKLIDILIPQSWDEEARAAILTEARNAVLDEELSASTSQALGNAIVETYMSALPKELDQLPKLGEAVQLASEKRSWLSAGQVRAKVAKEAEGLKVDIEQTLLQKLPGRKGLRNTLLIHRPEEMDRIAFLKILSRGTLVAGKVLDGVARGRSLTNFVTGGLVYLGRLFWGLVELAFPQGLTGSFLRRAVVLGLAFGIFMGLAGTIFSVPATASLGWECVGVFLAVDLVRFGLVSYARSKGKGIKIILVMLAILLLVLAGFFLREFTHFLGTQIDGLFDWLLRWCPFSTHVSKSH